MSELRRLLRTTLLTASTLLAFACGTSEDDGDLPLGDPDCDPILPFECALPWPSNLYLAKDPARKTGYSLRFGERSLPANKQEINIAPKEYLRLDGYGVGTPIMVAFPNLDISSLPSEKQFASSLAKDAAIVLLEVGANSVRRVPYFVELDKMESDPERQVLFVRPMEIFKEATRYVVAFRGLKDKSGAAIQKSPAFARLVSGKTNQVPALAPRQERFNEIFTILAAQGIDRESLTLAWDFVTASSQALHGDLLAMRDDALAKVGAMGPELTVVKATEYLRKDDGSGKPVNEHIALELEGTFEVPNYLADLTLPGFVGSKIRRDAMGRPLAEGTRKPRFWIRIPHTAIGGDKAHGIVFYGHGLLGSGDQVRGSFNSKIAFDHNLIFFAADLTGMANFDRDQVLLMLQELSRFSSQTDRLQHGLVEWVLLTRGVRERLETLPEVAAKKVRVDKSQVYYSGISQGGIFGASYVAISPDVTRGHLGVPGNNYSTLLHRSIDFAPFFIILQGAYRTPAEQAIVLSAIEQLWEATDPVSHLRHIHKEPYPGNKPHEVLLTPAKGDWQVAVLTNEVAARSDLGIAILENYDKDRSPELLEPVKYPRTGSGVVLYDFGNPWPTNANTPPKDELGDPHGKPRRLDSHNRQMVHFFKTGEIIDVCGGDGCRPE